LGAGREPETRVATSVERLVSAQEQRRAMEWAMCVDLREPGRQTPRVKNGSVQNKQRWDHSTKE